MRTCHLFLLVYLLGNSFGESRAKSTVRCASKETCGQVPDPTSNFLHCVGLPSTDTGSGHIQRLKGLLEATMDVFTFMKSSLTGVPLLSLQGALALNSGADPLQNEDVIRAWLDVKLTPMLKSVTKHFLSCMSTRSFSCSTYQIVVKEISSHFSGLDPIRQKWIYEFFMYPFLSRDGVDGCAKKDESSEEWLMKNFGSFSAMARVEDFSTLNMVFRGLDVLHLLSPAQKAELLLKPEVAGLDNGTLSLVFHSLLTGGGSGPRPTSGPGWGHNRTSPGYPPTSHPKPTYDPYAPTSPHNSLKEVANGFMMAFRPIGSFVHEFVSFTKERDVSQIRSTTLAQFVLNWTLAELADMYRPKDASVGPEMPDFDVTNVDDWYRHVVMPVLRRFLLDEEALMHPNLTLAFHQVFYLDRAVGNETSEDLDVCSITVDEHPCGLSDAVENVARVLHCAARTDLTMSEEVIMSLIMKMTERLNSLVKELSTANFTELASDFRHIVHEADSPSVTPEQLDDPDFIQLWFKVKLMPLLPDVPTDRLACLGAKNFSCPVFQTIVAALSEHKSFMDSDPKYSQNIYEHFIRPFLMRQQNTSDPQCISSANQSAEWLRSNFGVFVRFASIRDFYQFNANFSGLVALPLLTPLQTAELLLLPLPTPPEKDEVIRHVFDFLLASPQSRRLPEVLHYVVEIAAKVNPPCSIYELIFVRLYGAIQFLPPDVEPSTWAAINELITIAPEECVPENITCPSNPYNGTHICRGVDSSSLHSYLNTSENALCNVTLETYACAELENFTANQLASLLKCNLPGNNSRSRGLWKMVLTKLSFVLDPALDILANDMASVVPSAVEVLDVIGELRVSLLSDGQLRNSSVIRKWFSGGRLSSLLPRASGRFLHCLGGRNLSCRSYQQILQVFIQSYDDMTSKQRHVVLKDFVLRFLSHSGAECVFLSNSSAQWLRDNLGPFSELLSFRELIHLNPQFKPLEVLPLLTAKQIAELLLLYPPALPDRDVVINLILDHLTETPDQGRLPEVLINLPMFIEQGNFSCSSYRTLFDRLDLAMATVSLHVASSITYSKMVLSRHIPPGCIIYSGECNVTMTNETDICIGVNSTMLQLHLDSGRMNGSFCDFSLEEFACASVSSLKAEDLAVILACNRSANTSGSRPVWNLLLSKASHVLDPALDLLSNKTLDPRNPALSMILDSVREIRLHTFGAASLNNPAFLQLWLGRRLGPFLPAVSPDFLSCLATKGLNCSSYQQMVRILSGAQPHMTLARQMFVYTHFIKVFLTRNTTVDPSCSSNINNSGEWLQRNMGGFSALVSFDDLRMLYPDFSAMEALPQLTVRQLAEVSSTPGQLTSPAQVTRLTNHVPDRLLSAFFDDFSPAIMGHENLFPSPVRSAMLQVVFDRANLSDHSVRDSAILLWLHDRLGPLLVELSPSHVAPFFAVLEGRNCSIQMQGVDNLNLTISSLSGDTQKEVHNHIIKSLMGPVPIQCYGDNFNRSFYSFLDRSFLGFQFPNLTTFLSLMPHDRMHQLVNSMPPSHVGEFLHLHDVVDDDAELCVLYNNYLQTPLFLETETLPAVVQRPTLPCVFPMALMSSERSEVNAWFDRRLNNYLVYLTKSLISPNSTHNASCLAFQKLVVVLGEHNYSVADFIRQDVFTTIRSYLTSASNPRCYNAADPELNSTAWFVEYIGPFMPFLTLEDLQAFGSAQVIQVFTVNPLNIALLNHTVLPLNLTNYYTELIYLQDGNFNPLLLPLLCRCVAPGPAFTQLTANESVILLYNLTTLCTDLDAQVSSALAGNLGDNVDATAISALGNESTGLSTGQITTIRPQDLLTALGTLSIVTGWNGGQAMAIIHSLMSSGILQINSASSLFMLGSLVVGIPSSIFGSISGSQLITASRNPLFLTNFISASQAAQQTFVTQIISVNSNSETIIQNVPDELATAIPRPLLLGFSNSTSVLTTLNRKTWKQQQVELFFGVIAVEGATAQLGSANNLSSSVLQGFTCTSVRTIRRVQIRRLIKACRRRGRRRVTLVETQLTCMFNHIRGDSDVTSFELFPPDVLLYYDYSLVPQASCGSYFQQLAEADFSVFSNALGFKRADLFTNARSCLGITNTSLTEDNISVLGNMCCTLDGIYIQNSHQSILEKLNNCPDLTRAQALAVEALLESGNTQYGAASTWTRQTLEDLGMITLCLQSTFYDNFDRRTKRQFLRGFLRVLRRNGVSRRKRRTLKRQIRRSIRNRSKRSIESECTVGLITQVTISDETFPFDYDDVTQFNCCLSANTVRDNLAAITDKVDEEEYLQIVLSKLREAYANSTIPEAKVQVLGPASREATQVDINMWSIAEIDTLSALMDSSDGEWDPSLAKAIISKYLSGAGNTLGSAELNAIGGPNLCSLDANVLKTITQQSLRDADALTVSNCTTEKKRELFTIARQAFATNTRSSTVTASSYQLTQPYLGGATADYVRSLSSSGINMDLATFTSLDEDVVLNLTVSEVQGLLGTNLADLKSYENETLVNNWVSRQQQSELDTLGVGLVGGKDSPTASTTNAPVTVTNAPVTVTNAPVTNAPVTNAPVTNAPVTNAPVTNAPVTNAPVTNAPVTNAPVTNAPVTNAPVTNAPVTNAPVTNAPVTNAPVTNAPVTNAPVTNAPVTNAPVTNAPVTNAPVTNAPVTNAPVTNAPVTNAPVTNAPVTNAPITNAPVTNAPVTNAPVTNAPVTNAPVTNAPVTNAPVTNAPVTNAPVTNAPAVNATTTGSSGDRLRADAGFSILVLLSLLLASQHILT